MKTNKRQFYVIATEGDVEPVLYGPYSSKEERDSEALELRRQDSSDPKDGIYWQDRDGAKLTVGSYSGAFFDEADNCQTCGARPGEIHPSACANHAE